MPSFVRWFRNRDAAKSRKLTDQNDGAIAPSKPSWQEAWSRKEVKPDEVVELIHECTQEMKSRALDMPFLLLPFRPGTDPVGSKSFIRNFFKMQYEGTWQNASLEIRTELMLMEPIVLCGIMKWCWSRLPGGIVTWDTYELFKVGEINSKMSRNAFNTFIPMSTDSEARKRIIFDFFDLLAAIAARGKTNGLGGRKLSRMAGWWAFEHSDNGKGFDGGYSSWAKAADACSHLFFAYLRSLSPDSVGGVSGISQLPRSLQALLSQTEYPPETPTLMQKSTTKVVMIVNAVSPTPFALLRRAKNFEYRDDDEALQAFSSYNDPVSALTDECRRVLNRISATNQSSLPTNGTPIPDGAWSRFEDMGFSSLADTLSSPGDLAVVKEPSGILSGPHSRIDDLGRPTTPSWADFLSSGFPNDPNNTSVLLPPDKQLPPLQAGRGHSSQSHVRNGFGDSLEPGELASINRFDLDETFWWVWMTSLAGEETPERKAVFGRCALIETQIPRAPWLVIEEQVKGASPDQEQGMYLAEKKSRFSFTKRARLNRRKTHAKKAKEATPEPFDREKTTTPMSRIDPEQQAKVHAAAVKLAQDQDRAGKDAQRRGRMDDTVSMKTNSALTLQPLIMSEAAPALKWTNAYDNKALPNDKDALRSAYLRDPSTGRGRYRDGLTASVASSTHLVATNGSTTPKLERQHSDRELPALPPKAQQSVKEQQSTPAAPPPPTTPPQRPLERPVSDSTLPSASFDEKPALDSSVQHPAFRQQAPQISPESSKTPSPEAGSKTSPHKLQKKGGGGLKKLFARKKETGAIKSKLPVAVGGGQPIQFPKASDRASAVQSPTDTDPLPDEEPSRPSYQEQDIPHPEPRVTANESPPYRGHHSESSRIGTAEQLEANREFSRFDQGPLEDVPAFVPEDTADDTPTERSPMPEIQQFHPRATDIHPSAHDTHDETPFETPAEEPQQNLDSVSEASDDYQQTVPVTNHWARIRKNAAERAQRLSEEQSGRSRSQSARTDDGETSGEETIESRVARIKARVAELTGNIDAQGNIGTGARR